VQALAGVADQGGQARLDVQVHVLQRQLPVELAALDLAADLRHAALDVGQVLRADDALRGQHLGVRQAAGDVGGGQALVEEHAGGVALDQLAHGLGKQRGPGLDLVSSWLVDMAGGQWGEAAPGARMNGRRRPTNGMARALHWAGP
jgi:hypothetical protein